MKPPPRRSNFCAARTKGQPAKRLTSELILVVATGAGEVPFEPRPAQLLDNTLPAFTEPHQWHSVGVVLQSALQ
jgi:hypothetical protein